jgi:hypothetical protein
MRKILFILTVLFVPGIFLVSSCKKSGEAGPDKKPVKAKLSFPIQNEACTSGTIISNAQSSIVLKWAPSENTDSYEAVLKNLETGASTTQTSSTNELQVTIARNTPYSWYVVSRLAGTSSTAQSDTWKFYNSGPAVQSHAPFPAEMVSPAIGGSVNAVNGKITLDWNGADVDNDISSYDVYLGTTATPALLLGNVTESILNEVAVTGNATYYWKIVTKDAKGNTSDSGIYQFRVN